MAQGIELAWPQQGESSFAADAAQRAVIDHEHGHLRVLAGPGTGKTSVIVAAVRQRIQRGQPAGSMLVLTYGRMAAQELRTRLTVGSSQVPVATTFHALAYRLLLSDDASLRLMGAPEQEAVLREILRRTDHLPAELRAARTSRGLAEQVRSFIGRAQSQAIAPAQAADDDALRSAAAAIYAEYLDILGFAGSLDYAELIRRATDLVTTAPPLAVQQLRTIFVDEYQDTDPSQVLLLKALAAHGAQVIAVGDPDQSIYGFRGADASGILRFDEEFAEPSCETVTLGATRRFGPQIGAVARRVVPANALGPVPAEQVRAHRHPDAIGPSGDVAVRLYESEAAQADHIADLLRRVHAGSSEVFPNLKLDWSDMAVLVRSGSRDIPVLQRAMLAAGIPVEIARDDIPVAMSGAVQPLLDVLRVAADVDGGLTVERAAALLASPLCGLEPRRLAILGRQLRRGPGDASGPARPSGVLLVEALRDPDLLAGIDESLAAPVGRLSVILERATRRVDQGWPPSRILDEVWRATRWPQRLRADALAGGRRAREANRDLDAVVELFEQAEQSDLAFESVRSVAGFLEQLEAQIIPAAPHQQRPWNRNAVRLLTAHRAKGSQWPLVVVAGVQSGRWPDLRPRPMVFDAAPESGWREQQLLDERRLFFVACTRASSALLVTAVRSSAEDGDEPSPFVALAAGDDEPIMVHGRPHRPLTPVGVVAGLRQYLLDPQASPAMKAAVAERLADLATQEDAQGRLIYPWADPQRWWGRRSWSGQEMPWYDPEQPLTLSASGVESYLTCPRRWFLEKRVRATGPATTNMAFGNVLHLCAQAVTEGELAADPDTIAEVLDSVWEAVGYQPGWQERFEREQAQQATVRLLTWMRNAPGELVGAEVPFEVQLTLDGDEEVTVVGQMDRIDRVDDDVVITDYKTGRAGSMTKAKVDEHIQLGIYRWVAELQELGPAGDAVAQLLYLREKPPLKEPEQGAKVMKQSGDDPTAWLAPLISSVAAGIRAQSAPARPSDQCDRCALATSCPARPEGREVRP